MGPSRKIARFVADPAIELYTEVLDEMWRAHIPALVGGTYALSHYVGFERPTKDLDLFVRPESAPDVVEHFQSLGFDAEMTYPHWLAKIRRDDHFVDVVFSSGNGIARVDDGWFDHAVEHTVFDMPVLLNPVEEMIWSKAFVQERERYDGADVIHLLFHRSQTLDWKRLLARFGPHWRVLFSYLVLFGFVYPADRGRIPAWVIDELMARFVVDATEPESRVCNGTLLSREQYLTDIERRKMVDPRLAPIGHMTSRDLAIWTAAIGDH